MSFNPYDQLDVPRDATAADMRAAYKRRAKATHPDQGGSDADFRLVQLAYEILSDPAKRARYDRDGTAEEAKPDNSRPAALGLIDGHMGPIIQRYIMGGFAGADDPRRKDLIGIITGALECEISTANNSIHQAEQAVAFMRDMAGRFDTKDDSNPLAAKFAAQIAAIEKSIVDVRDGIRLRRLAIDILAGYKFRHEKLEPEEQANRSPYIISTIFGT